MAPNLATMATMGCNGEARVLSIPRRYSHFIFGITQSGLTCLIAAAIASYPLLEDGFFLTNWLRSWVISWMTMLPVVLIAAPRIRSLALFLTREDDEESHKASARAQG